MENNFRDETVTIPILTALKIEVICEMLTVAINYAKSGVQQSLLVPVLEKAFDGAEEIQAAIVDQLTKSIGEHHVENN